MTRSVFKEDWTAARGMMGGDVEAAGVVCVQESCVRTMASFFSGKLLEFCEMLTTSIGHQVKTLHRRFLHIFLTSAQLLTACEPYIHALMEEFGKRLPSLNTWEDVIDGAVYDQTNADGSVRSGGARGAHGWRTQD